MAARELVRTFDDVVAVDGGHFVVPTGSVHGLTGSHGAGKTTTVRASARRSRD